MSFINRKKSNKVKKLLIYIVVLLVVGITAFVFLSPTFEKNAPKVEFSQDKFWNFKKPLEIKFSDDNEIKSYKVAYFDGKELKKLETKVLNNNGKEIIVEVIPPKFNRLQTAPKQIVLKTEVIDSSKWNFFKGNVTREDITIDIDRKNPVANVIANSYLIRQGGSASVVVEVKDENLKDFYISFNDEERFELIPFYKKNFYMAIVAWPVTIEEFKRVNLVAIDKAGNKTTTKVPYYIKNLNVKVDDIKISRSFVNKVSKNVLSKSGYDIPDGIAEAFVMANKDLRAENVKIIKDVSRQNLDYSMVSSFDLDAFKQLKGSKTFSRYAERRHYYYNGEKIDEAWHLGMDWASIRNAKIYVTNPGKVVFKEYLGIYGHTAIIDHGFGLSTLYAHTSKLNVELNDFVNAKQHIANTGSTGAVFGDHLHFGVLVQGLEVNPLEWMDKKWIDINIKKILNQAKKVIDTK